MFKTSRLMRIGKLAFWGLMIIFILPTRGIGASSVIDEAKKEKKLVIYLTATLKDVEKIYEAFKKEYPFLEIDTYRSGSQGFLTKTMNEVRAGRHNADVYYTNSMNIHILKKENLLMKYVSPGTKTYPNWLKDPQGFWVGSYYFIRVPAYNTKLVSQQSAPRSYEDLLDPKWKGKIGMSAEEYEWFGMQLKVRGEEKGLQFMKNLSKQDIRFQRGKTLSGNMLIAGEFAILVNVNAYTIEGLKEKGAPVEWFRAEPTVGAIMVAAVAANAPRPNAAKLFVDFMLSKKGQELIRDSYFIPAAPDLQPRPSRLIEGAKPNFEDPLLYERMNYYSKLWGNVFYK